MRKLLSQFCVISLLYILAVNCGESREKKTETIAKKIETAKGADLSVPAELGGNGFEKIAEKLGIGNEGIVSHNLKKAGIEKNSRIRRFYSLKQLN